MGHSLRKTLLYGRLSAGESVASSSIDTSLDIELAYVVTSKSVGSTQSLLRVALQAHLGGDIWRALQTTLLSGTGEITSYHPIRYGKDIRIEVICLAGQVHFDVTRIGRPISEEPENFTLDPNSLLYVNPDRKVSELSPPDGPGMYLGTDPAAAFGYHPLPSGGGSGEINITWNEVPAGSIDGTNVVFNVQYIPHPTNSMSLYLNGIRLSPDDDFILDGKSITYHPDQTPQVGDKHIASYQHL